MIKVDMNNAQRAALSNVYVPKSLRSEIKNTNESGLTTVDVSTSKTKKTGKKKS